MVKTKQHNAVGHHNGDITRPVIIIFYAEPKTGEHAEMVREVLGAKLMRVRRFNPQYLVLATVEHNYMESVTTPNDRDTLKAISLLRYAHTSEDGETTAKALRDAAQILLPNHPARAELVKPELYISLLNRGMHGAKLVMWTSPQSQTIPAVMCPSLRVALFVATAYKAVAACANCQKLFALDAERLDGSYSERYCTASCGQKFRQRMYRLRVKAG